MKNKRRVLSALLVVAIFAIYCGAASLAQAASDSKTQTITLSVTSTITLTLADATVALGTLTPGTPIFAATSLSVTTNEYNGWNLQVKRDDPASTLNMNGTSTPDITFPDATPWNYSVPNGSITPGANLSFHVLQTGTDAALYDAGLWGTDDTAPNALYAGFPSANQQIASVGSYVGTAQTVAYALQADAPGTQQSGNYSGTITMTAITNP